MKELYEQASQLAGRTVEVEQTTDGKFIVLWMNLNHAPPPKGDTELEALQNFINMMKSLKPEDTDGRNDGDNAPDSQVVS